MKRFAFLFTVGGKIVISRENSLQLQHRMRDGTNSKAVRDDVAHFVEHSFPGDDMSLCTGEVIFCISGW